MSYIRTLKAIEILDSRGNPTIEVTITTDRDITAIASVPSGASTGEHEALELRDKDLSRYFGRGVQRAVHHINGPLAELLVGEPILDQERLDRLMIAKDGTENKEKLGANAILGTSIAIARAASLTTKLPLYRYLGGSQTSILPCPMINIINGGAHADNALDFQEFLIRPVGAPSFNEAVRWGAEVFHTLKKILKAAGHITAVGDEGGFAPNLTSNEAALELIVKAIEKAGYQPGSQISLGIDCAASEFFDKSSQRYIEKKRKERGEAFKERTADEQATYLKELCKKFPIDSIEDPLDEGDWSGWQTLSALLGKSVQIIGDDIFVTNPKFLQKGIDLGIANAILIKPNQIGTITETLETIRIARDNGYATIISHRSGETEDTLIADLAVAVNAGQIKTGSLSRTDRIAKYNRLLNIENELGSIGSYLDSNKYSKINNKLN